MEPGTLRLYMPLLCAAFVVRITFIVMATFSLITTLNGFFSFCILVLRLWQRQLAKRLDVLQSDMASLCLPSLGGKP